MAGPDHRTEPTIEEITGDNERTRQEVSETVVALSDKLDVKGRAEQAAADAKDRVVDTVTNDTGSIPPAVPAAAAAIATAGLLLGIIVYRRRHR